MEKTLVNALAYSRVVKFLMVFILFAVVIADILVISIVFRVIGYATPEERTRIISLLVLLIAGSAAGFPLFYFIYRSLRDQWIKTDEHGITYNSWSKKISASWDEVTSVSIVSRGRYGQALRNKALRIDTKNGNIYALPIFVDKSMPIPQLRMGISSQKLSYPNGRMKKLDVQNSDVYEELENYIPHLIKP